MTSDFGCVGLVGWVSCVGLLVGIQEKMAAVPYRALRASVWSSLVAEQVSKSVREGMTMDLACMSSGRKMVAPS